MSRGFCLCEVKDSLKITDAHFSVTHNEIENAKPGGIGAGQKNLGTQVNIEML